MEPINMEEGRRSEGFPQGNQSQQPNGVLPRSVHPHPFEPPTSGAPASMGNGSVGGSFVNSMSRDDQQQQSMARSHRDRGDGPPAQVQRSSSRDSIKKEKIVNNINAIPKIVKIAVIGDSTVGKTSICHAVTSESFNFNKNYHLTCGVGIYPKSIKLPEPSEGQDDRVNIVLVDSSGKDIYLDYLPKYWEKLEGLAVVIDLTSKSSLQSATDWVHLALESIPPRPRSDSSDFPGSESPCLGVLIGNKTDLNERRVISPQVALDFAKKFNLQYFECSAKENSGLEEPFFFLAHKWVRKSLGKIGSSSSDKENVGKSQK